MGEKLKILVCGDVQGNFKSLSKRVSSVNEKSGPFDYLLCVGSFFGSSDAEWNLMKSGALQLPISTYVLGPNNTDHLSKFSDISGCELCPNVNYLGKRGVFTTSGGLRLAYVSGKQGDSADDCTFSEADAVCVCDICVRGHPQFKGVDILLSSVWPAGVTRLHDGGVKNPPPGSPVLSWLAAHIKPRYHFSGVHDVHYERPPYKNESAQGDVTQHSTRFIALASVGSASKQKWLYALSIVPIESMRVMDLYQGTTDETPSPYTGLAFQPSPSELQQKSSQFFYDMKAPQDGNERKRKGQGERGGDRKKRDRPVFDQEKCWFCLASPQVEKHLVISIGSEVYLALAKGGLVDGHVLILPITHHQSTAEAPETLMDEIDRFKDSLKKMFRKQKKAVVFYERNYKTSHMQIQAIPIPENATRELLEIFKDCAEAQGFELDEVPEHTKLSQIAAPGTPYFYAELPNGNKLFHRIRKSFSLNFGREVLASGPVLDMEDRADWRDCKIDKEEECSLVKQFRSAFTPFDFTLSD